MEKSDYYLAVEKMILQLTRLNSEYMDCVTDEKEAKFERLLELRGQFAKLVAQYREKK